ncbi:hypothetical protein CEK25_003108 [Fusarium fujikuroi]|nr:hypothetical protein CEK25_003108 [Fusarium fujikuroi]
MLARIKESGLAAVEMEVGSKESGSLDALLNNAGTGGSQYALLIHADITKSTPVINAIIRVTHELFRPPVFSIIRVTHDFIPLLIKSTHDALLLVFTSGAGILGTYAAFQGTAAASVTAAESRTGPFRSAPSTFTGGVINLFTGAGC